MSLYMIGRVAFQVIIILALSGITSVNAGGFKYRFASVGEDPSSARTVVGCIRSHTVTGTETLLDIAREYGLGFNDIEILHPEVNPWIPEAGVQLSIPTCWILPPSKYEGVVINLPELRLYRFFPRVQMVKTYPVGIGVMGWETPEGNYRVVDRQEDPTWMVPLSLREKYGIISMPPGSENPLGKYWIGLSIKGYGMHGTNFPWGVGRLVSHGCIRLYPEHIAKLYQEVPVNTPVEIIYEPVKLGFKDRGIFIEVHPDLYGKIPDLEEYTLNRLKESALMNFISMEKVKAALERQNGVPVCIGMLRKGGDISVAKEAAVSPCRNHLFTQLDKEENQ
jgi:L,D-transpeptidase ErfK/SrfK